MVIKFLQGYNCRVVFYDEAGSWDESMTFETATDAIAYCENVIDVALQAKGADIININTGNIIAYCCAEDWDPDSEDDDEYWDDGCPIEDYNEVMSTPSYHNEWDHWDDNSPWIEDSEPADIDDDYGFDPYEGCFTYDC